MWTNRKENCSTRVSLCGGRLGRAMFLAAVCSALSMAVAERALAQDRIANSPPPECGDDIVNTPDETCDGTDAGAAGC